jgi:hypothetical protein
MELVKRRTARPERLVSLYLTLISAAVSRMASIASSKVTLYTPSLAIESWAAVTAFTAVDTRKITEVEVLGGAHLQDYFFPDAKISMHLGKIYGYDTRCMGPEPVRQSGRRSARDCALY